MAGGTTVELNLAPYESRVLVYADRAGPPEHPTHGTVEVLDISSDWKVQFTALNRSVEMRELRSWTDDDATKFFSGTATYTRPVTVPDSFLNSGREVVLTFGEGRPVTPTAGPANGMRAWFESPVREAAIVTINGRRVGAIWRPPYEIDVTKLLKRGVNSFHIEVANLAINEMAGRSLPDYKLLNLRYGVRFQPQDMENLQPLTSGMMGPIRVITR